MTTLRIAVSVLVSLTLAFGVAACIGTPEASEPPADNPSEELTSLRYVVDLPVIEGAEFEGDYRRDPNHSEFALLVDSLVLELDEEQKVASIVVAASLPNVEEGCKLGEDIAMALSEYTRVTTEDGTVVDDYSTPYGALYEVWSLNIRITGEGGDESLLLDGWLPAGADTMTWQ